MTPAQQIRAYLAAQPPAARKHLKTLQSAIRAAAPDAIDAFSYSMPAVRLDGRLLLGYAGWKEHVSLYPFGPDALTLIGADASRFKTSKGTIQFPLDRPIPVALVKRLVKARAARLRGRERT